MIAASSALDSCLLQVKGAIYVIPVIEASRDPDCGMFSGWTQLILHWLMETDWQIFSSSAIEFHNCCLVDVDFASPNTTA